MNRRQMSGVKSSCSSSAAALHREKLTIVSHVYNTSQQN